MVSSFVKRLAATTLIVMVLVALFAARINGRVALTYLVSSTWMLLNLFVWTGFVMTLTTKSPKRPVLLPMFVLLKLGFLAGGVVALSYFKPYTAAQVWAIVGGISTLLVVAVLKAAGARLTGNDLFRQSAAAMIFVMAMAGSGWAADTAAQPRSNTGTEAMKEGATRDIGHAHTAVSDEHGTADAHATADEHSTGAAHGGGHEAAAVPELPSFATVILHTETNGKPIRDTDFGHILHRWEKQLFMLISVAMLSLFIFGTLRYREFLPGKLQSLLEIIVEGFYKFIGGILGEHQARVYTPFLASLFVFIIVNNLMGIVPLMAASTSKYQTTVALALIVFFYIHINGIRETGIWPWFHHLLGSPRDVVGWAMTPLMLPLEVIGTLAKPLSLSLRLFGNIMGEDILIGVFLMMGMMLMGAVWPDPWVGVPLHLPFYFLALLTCTIQALVFMLLSTIYLLMLLPHEDHGSGHEHAEETEHPALPADNGPHIEVQGAPSV